MLNSSCLEVASNEGLKCQLYPGKKLNVMSMDYTNYSLRVSQRNKVGFLQN
jgi:hypothetical protein